MPGGSSVDVVPFIQRDKQLRQFLHTIPDEELHLFRVKNYRRGEHVIREGDRADAVYIIVSGLCHVLCHPSSTLVQPRAQLGYLDIVGLFELIQNLPRVGDVVAYRNSTALCIERDVFLRWVETHPHFLLELATNVIQRLYQDIDHICERTKSSTYYGVICALIWNRNLLNRKTPDFTGPVKIDYTRQYLADFIGKDVRSVSRAMEHLLSKGLISKIHGKIYVTADQVAALEREKLAALK